MNPTSPSGVPILTPKELHGKATKLIENFTRFVTMSTFENKEDAIGECSG
jgi:hypothetical protein